ncbi:translocation/assembly module TamB domain-containing protein [candidate division KSB1 bacterium]|nr:translocation/assembly module TamB domain-containing protein [candidate division KSB1 bacterium]
MVIKKATGLSGIILSIFLAIMLPGKELPGNAVFASEPTLKSDYFSTRVLSISYDSIATSPGVHPNSENIRVYRIGGTTFRADSLSGLLIHHDGHTSLQQMHFFAGKDSIHIKGVLPIEGNPFTAYSPTSKKRTNLWINLNRVNLANFLQSHIGDSLVLPCTAVLQITGDLSSPQIFGRVNINKGYLAFANDTLQALKSIHAEIEFTGEAALLRSFKAQAGENMISLRGEFADSRSILRAFDLQFDARNIVISKTNAASVCFDKLKAYIIRKDGQTTIAGYGILGNSIVKIEPKSLEVLWFFNIFSSYTRLLEQIFPAAKANFWLYTANNFWFDDPVARVRTDVFCSIKGSLESLKYNGYISVVEGKLLYFNRKFNIESGLISFSNESNQKSSIDLAANTKIASYENPERNEYEIHLAVTGDYHQPAIKLTSKPTLSERHIRALLAVGKTREGLIDNVDTTSSRNLQQKLMAQAKKLDNKSITQVTERQVGKLLNLEHIALKGNLFKFSDYGPRLTARKRLAKKLNLFYTTVVGHANEQHVKLDYELKRHLSIEGETNQEGEAGIDLKLKYRF